MTYTGWRQIKLGEPFASIHSESSKTKYKNAYPDRNVAEKKDGHGENKMYKEDKRNDINKENFGLMDPDSEPSFSSLENDIHPIIESDFSYTYSPIVHGPKWYPTML